MASIGVIPNTHHIHAIVYKPEFSVVCIIGKAPFHGRMKIVFCPDKYILEFESFEAWLRSIALEEFTVESLCRHVYDTLQDFLGDVYLSVSIKAMTTVHGEVIAKIKGEK